MSLNFPGRRKFKFNQPVLVFQVMLARHKLCRCFPPSPPMSRWEMMWLISVKRPYAKLGWGFPLMKTHIHTTPPPLQHCSTTSLLPCIHTSTRRCQVLPVFWDVSSMPERKWLLPVFLFGCIVWGLSWPLRCVVTAANMWKEYMDMYHSRNLDQELIRINSKQLTVIEEVCVNGMLTRHL